jgi:hypothetical protein
MPEIAISFQLIIVRGFCFDCVMGLKYQVIYRYTACLIVFMNCPVCFFFFFCLILPFVALTVLSVHDVAYYCLLELWNKISLFIWKNAKLVNEVAPICNKQKLV